MLLTMRAAQDLEEGVLASRSLLIGSHCQPQVRTGAHLPHWQAYFSSLLMLGQVHGAPRRRVLVLTASPGPPHHLHHRPQAGLCLPRSPWVLLTRAGGHTAELSLQLGTLAGLAAVLGGHAGPHPAPGPPPAAAGAQAPGPPLLPHAVHCKEARGRWLGRTLAPPTASVCPSTHQSGAPQLSGCSLLALPWVLLPGYALRAPGLRPLREHRLLGPTHRGQTQ